MTKKFPGQDAVTRMFALVKAGLAGKLDKIGGSPGQVLGFGDAGQVGAVTIRAGDNVSVTRSGNVITISADGGGQSSGRIFTVSVDTDPEGGGSVEGGGMLLEGAQCTVTACAGEGYTFAGWQADGSTVSTDVSYTFTVTGDVTLTAVFKEVQKELVYHGTAANLRAARSYLVGASSDKYAMFAGGYVSKNFDTVDAFDGSLTRISATPLNKGKASFAASTIGRYILFGGWDETVDAYDEFLTRTTPTSLSVGRGGLAAASVGNYCLFAGGGGNAADAYDSALTRTTATPLNSTRSYLAAASIGNYAMFGGGFGSYNTVDAYDSSLTRTTPDTLSVSREYLAAASVGNYALFGGGNDYNDNISCVVDAYDESLTRTSAETMYRTGGNIAASAVEGYALFGGGSYSLGYSDAVNVYNSSLTRSFAYLSEAREKLAGASVGNYALFGGGTNRINGVQGYSAVIDVFTLK